MMKSKTSELENEKVKGITSEELKSKFPDKEIMKQASSDPLFLMDLKEIKNDFDEVDYE